MDPMVIIWLCVVVVFAIVEALTSQMVCIWFVAAALLTLVCALLGAPYWAQLTIFVLCAALLLIFTRPFVKRIMKGPRSRTNADRVIGETAVVVQEIDNDISAGQVKVLGQIWTARSVLRGVIPVDAKVIVRSIEGVKLIVEELKEES